MIKTVTTTAGVNTVTFPEFFKYFWIKNIGDTTVYASAFADVSAGVDNSSVINAGDAVCIDNVDNNDVYISGAGSVEIHAQNNPDCPFKVGGKGGEIPDLSAYAKTADVPNIKVNAAVNADTVGGHSVGCDVPENAVFTDTVVDINTMEYSVDFSTISWETSYLGKFESYITLNNVNKIISVNLGAWNNFNSDDIVQATIIEDKIFGFMSNTAKSNGHMTFRITYI